MDTTATGPDTGIGPAMPSSPVNEVVLCRRQPWATFALFSLLVLAITLGEVLFIASEETGSFGWQSLVIFAADFHERLMGRPKLSALIAVALLASLVFFAGQLIVLWKSRLILNASGIRYQSPKPSSLKWFYGGWMANWADITGMWVARSKFGTLPVELTIETASQRKTLSVFEWVEVGRQSKALERTLFRPRTKPQVLAKALEEQSIMQYLRALGISVDIDLRRAPLGSGGFNLGANRHAVFALLLVVALVAYAAVEALVSTRLSSPNTPLMGVCIGAGVFVAVLFAMWLRKANVPNLESTVIGMSLGGASAAVLYFVL